jgi:hypothetical protein
MLRKSSENAKKLKKNGIIGPGAADMDRRYSHGGHHKYPVYEGMELAGGAQKQQQSEKPPEKKHNSSEDNKPTGSTSGREKDQQ